MSMFQLPKFVSEPCRLENFNALDSEQDTNENVLLNKMDTCYKDAKYISMIFNLNL